MVCGHEGTSGHHGGNTYPVNRAGSCRASSYDPKKVSKSRFAETTSGSDLCVAILGLFPAVICEHASP